MKTLYYISLLVGILLLNSCAQISAPTGGNIDKSPPKLDSLGTIPLNYSTKFKGSKIVMTFNEYFVLKNPKETVFFSPNVENNPEFIVKGKTLTILLNNELKENTTYTINFGDAISDYTVGNKIPDFKYVFSTGNYIDSMSTRGKVIDAYSGTPIKEVVVMLYEDLTDSVVSKMKPMYYSVTNKDGNYEMTNLKAGTYKLFALKDENRNYLYDLPNEQVGESDSTISLLTDTIRSYSIISLYTKDYKKQAVASKKYEYPGKLVFTFIRSAKSINIYNKDSTKLEYESIEINEKRDSVVIWKPTIGKERTALRIVLDTTNEVGNIYPFSIPSKETEINILTRARSIDQDESFFIEFDRPIKSFNKEKIKLFKDKLEVEIDSIILINKKLIIYFPKKEDESFKYQLLPTAITDIFETTFSDTLNGFISVRKNDYFGSFTLKLEPKNDSVSFLISIINEKGKVIENKKAKGNIELNFKKLEPGKYKIKAIEDYNSNGEWDTGDYYLKQKPEQVFYFPKVIEIRSNWEMAESWSL